MSNIDELFNEWLNKESLMKFSERELFYNNRLTQSMQWGVYQDFYRRYGINIYASRSYCWEKKYSGVMSVCGTMSENQFEINDLDSIEAARLKILDMAKKALTERLK